MKGNSMVKSSECDVLMETSLSTISLDDETKTPHSKYSRPYSLPRFHLSPLVYTFALLKQIRPTCFLLQKLLTLIVVLTLGLTTQMSEDCPTAIKEVSLKCSEYFWRTLMLHIYWSNLPPRAPRQTIFFPCSDRAQLIDFSRSLVSWSEERSLISTRFEQYSLTSCRMLSISPTIAFRLAVSLKSDLQNQLAPPSQRMTCLEEPTKNLSISLQITEFKIMRQSTQSWLNLSLLEITLKSILASFLSRVSNAPWTG